MTEPENLDFEVAVIGAGFGGIGAGIKFFCLGRMGLDDRETKAGPLARNPSESLRALLY